MADFSEKIQALMDEVYNEWQKDENKGKGKWDVLNGFSEAHQIAVVFGNFNHQVENGGIEQWIFNGYFHDDAEKFTEFLEIGAETDERCRFILDKVYLLDQYAQETGCDRDGYYRDDDGESSSIGEMINGDAFDTWYYANCGNEDWWELVSGTIDKAEERGLAPTGQYEQDEGDANIKPPLQVYIWNVHDDRIGGFTMPLPATMEELQPFLDSAEITGWQDVEILEVSSDISGLGEALTENIRKTMTKDALDELNYLAARIGALQGGNGHDMFAAAVETKRYNGSVAEIINLTFSENLNRFDLLPAFTDEQYGEFLLDFGGDEHADAFNRLDNSDDPTDAALAKYIEKLEKYADREAYGRDAIKAENGVLTDKGLLIGGDGIQSIYHGSQDIPAEHRIFTESGEIVRPPMKIDEVDVAAVVLKLHAISGGDNMHSAEGNIKTLRNRQSRDFLLMVSRDDVILYPAIEAYKRGTEAVAHTSLLKEQPDTMVFAVRVRVHDEAVVTGDLVEINAKALRESVSRHAAAPNRIDAVFSNGATKSYDLWAWAELPPYARDDIRDYDLHYPQSGLNTATQHCTRFIGANEMVSDAKSFDDYLPVLNAARIAAAENPQPDMIRITNEAAKEILARGSDVYKLTPDGAQKLSAIEAMRPLCFAEHRDLAINSADTAALDKWAERKVSDINRQAEREQRNKTKNKAEEL